MAHFREPYNHPAPSGYLRDLLISEQEPDKVRGILSDGLNPLLTSKLYVMLGNDVADFKFYCFLTNFTSRFKGLIVPKTDAISL